MKKVNFRLYILFALIFCTSIVFSTCDTEAEAEEESPITDYGDWSYLNYFILVKQPVNFKVEYYAQGLYNVDIRDGDRIAYWWYEEEGGPLVLRDVFNKKDIKTAYYSGDCSFFASETYRFRYDFLPYKPLTMTATTYLGREAIEYRHDYKGNGSEVYIVDKQFNLVLYRCLYENDKPLEKLKVVVFEIGGQTLPEEISDR